ncbi:MAG TPA: Mini-ribonuclease 3 [Clostridiales bacterium]|jgi:ribonuclease-3 family protein|nr:Mini-ribonuclease 3 [Clostridiales bacterium]
MFRDGDKVDTRTLSPIQLAYIGDAVYELLVRTYLITNKELTIDKMHKSAVEFVKAEKQAMYLKEIENILTDEEKDIVRRGRNSKSIPPKNTSFMDYKYATGFEALIGYLYLKKNKDRIFKFFEIILSSEKE